MNRNVEVASCSRCLKRTDGNPPFCTWLMAEIPLGLADDPECEGFAVKPLRTSKGKAEHPNTSNTTPSNACDDIPNCRLAIPKTACPKNPDKSLIQTVLKLKGFKGSVVKEKVCCGKPGCHCQSGALHGPYSYLHYYSDGKVRRRYLSNTMSALLSHSKEELESILHETEPVLGQERKLEVR